MKDVYGSVTMVISRKTDSDDGIYESECKFNRDVIEELIRDSLGDLKIHNLEVNWETVFGEDE